MRVLVIGSGGREHALAWRLRRSPGVTELLAAPGNYGTAQLGTNLPLAETDLDGIAAAAASYAVDLVTVGPEIPLAMGLADRLNAAGIPVFGPSQAAARLESSKSFARDVMDAAGVPGPNYRVFDDPDAALRYIDAANRPLVVKADGLAAGKGVAMCATPTDAKAAVQACMAERIFGAAGNTIVVEDWIRGNEVSVFGFTDGVNLSAVAAATDYKRAGDGDTGPNTGGMGSYGPPHFWNDAMAELIRRDFMLPVIAEMGRRGCPYRGALYCGLMLTDAGPCVLEFNCRFGDPETQVIMPQLLTDPAAVMLACANGSLDDAPPVEWSPRPTVGVVLASGGYPGLYRTGYPVSGLDADAAVGVDIHSDAETGGSLVFCAGVNPDADNRPVTAGGRVLCAVGCGATVSDARRLAYSRIDDIGFQGAYCRRDIAELPALTPR